MTCAGSSEGPPGGGGGRRPRIVMDVSPTGSATGIGRYTGGLACALKSDWSDHLDFVFATRKHPSALPLPGAVHIRVPGGRLSYQFLGGRALNRYSPAVYLGPDFTVPRGLSLPSAVVVHDLSPWEFPAGLSWRARLLYRTFTPSSLQEAKCIFVDSEFTRSRLRTRWGSHRAVVAYPGLDPVFYRPLVALPPPAFQDLPEPFVLFVGVLDERRCATETLETILKMKAEKAALHFVVAGRIANPALRVSVSRLSTRGIFYFPRVSEDSLLWLYAHASALLYFSRYEGFGYPPVEALACGTPIVVTDIPVFRETVGDFAAFVSLPVDPDAAAKALLAACERKGDAALANASAAVRERFRWSSTARTVANTLIEIYETTYSK